MIKIGNRTLIFSETVLCPFNEDLELDINVPNEDVPWVLRISFIESNKDASEEEKKARMHLSDDDDGVARATFFNFKNALGSTLRNPVEVAKSDIGEPITMLAEVAKLPTAYRANLQFMIEEAKNG